MNEEEVRAIKQRHSARLLQQPGVSGVGVEKDADGAFCITVHVDANDSQAHTRLPSHLDGAPVRVVRSGPFRPL